MIIKTGKLGAVLAVAALVSACSRGENQSSQTLGVNQQSNAGAQGSYLVIECNQPGSHLVDKSGKDVLTPVKLTVQLDKQTLSSISLSARIPAHINLEDPARASVGERLVELADARVVSGSPVSTRSKEGVKYGLADNQKIAVTRNGQKNISNLKSLEISEAKGADYLSISMEIEGTSGKATESVLLSGCDMKNRSLLGKYPK